MNEVTEKKQGAKGDSPAYEITGIAPGLYHFTGFGEVDLTELPSDQVCEKLVKKKFPYIRKK